MASDTQSKDSHRKHRRSTSDDEVEKSSKRHKHRHHHHRHRHHRSKKHEDESNHGGEDFALPVSSNPVANNGFRVDDDVEEGEILEEDNIEKPGNLEASDFADRTDSRNPVCSDCL